MRAKKMKLRSTKEKMRVNGKTGKTFPTRQRRQGSSLTLESFTDCTRGKTTSPRSASRSDHVLPASGFP